MIKEIEKEDFGMITPLLNETADNVEVKSIIEGINPGWIFVDSISEPKVAMVWSKGQEGFYFVGREEVDHFNRGLNDFIDYELKDRAIEAGLNRFEFSGDTDKWHGVFADVFSQRRLNISTQYIYKLDKSDWIGYIKRDNMTDFKIHRIDHELLTSRSLKNVDFIRREILRWWGSIDDFLRQSFGYCMVDKDTIANYSMGNFYIDQVMTIGIETLEKYRRLGLSQITSEAFVQTCFDKNYAIQWECMGENVASYTLAEKMNFRRTSEYTLYSFPL